MEVTNCPKWSLRISPNHTLGSLPHSCEVIMGGAVKGLLCLIAPLLITVATDARRWRSLHAHRSGESCSPMASAYWRGGVSPPASSKCTQEKSLCQGFYLHLLILLRSLVLRS